MLQIVESYGVRGVRTNRIPTDVDHLEICNYVPMERTKILVTDFIIQDRDYGSSRITTSRLFCFYFRIFRDRILLFFYRVCLSS